MQSIMQDKHRCNVHFVRHMFKNRDLRLPSCSQFRTPIRTFSKAPSMLLPAWQTIVLGFWVQIEGSEHPLSFSFHIFLLLIEAQALSPSFPSTRPLKLRKTTACRYLTKNVCRVGESLRTYVSCILGGLGRGSRLHKASVTFILNALFAICQRDAFLNHSRTTYLGARAQIMQQSISFTP